MGMDEIVVNTKALGSQADPRVVAARFGFQAVWADIDERAIKAADISEDGQRAGPAFVVDEPPGPPHRRPPSDEARDLASPGPLQAKIEYSTTYAPLRICTNNSSPVLLLES